MSTYGQFCPIAKAMELLDERWTLLVVSELLRGSVHFNDLRRGLPKMSPALLSKRLKSLSRAGVVERSEVDGRTSYSLTPCGQELAGVVEALGAWGIRWIGELGDGDLDPHLLMWDIRRTISVDAWPRARTVVAFRLAGVDRKAAHWWLMVVGRSARRLRFRPRLRGGRHRRGQPAHPDPDLARRPVMVEGDAQRRLTIHGATDARRAVPGWLGQSPAAAVPRPA